MSDNSMTEGGKVVTSFGRKYRPPNNAGELYNFPPTAWDVGGKPDELPRLLVVYGFVTNHDIAKGELHSHKADLNDWGKPIPCPAETVENLLRLGGFSPTKWDIVFVGYPIHRVNELSPQQKAIALEFFDYRLNKWIKSIGPDRILFLGAQPFHDETKRPHIGRVFKYKGQANTKGRLKKAVKAVWTLCATHLTVNDETTSSLLGQAISHVKTLKRGKNAYTFSEVPHTYEMVDTIDKLRSALAAFAEAPLLSIDTEADNLNRIVNNIISIQVATAKDRAYFIPITHYESPWNATERDVVITMLRDFFESYRGIVIGAHLKFECIQMRAMLGCRHLPFDLYDIAAGRYALDENAKFYASVGMSAWGLERMERDYGYRRPVDVLAKDQRGNMAAQPLERIAPYGVLDVITPFHIYEMQLQEAQDRAYKGFDKYVRHLCNMVHVFASMEVRGIPINTPYLLSLRQANGPLRKLLREVKQKLLSTPEAQEANKRLLAKRGAPAKGLWGGGKQVAQIFDIDKQEDQQVLFFDVMQLTGYQITSTGKRSIGKKFLKANKAIPFVADYIDYVEAKKVKTGFVDSFAKIMTRSLDAVQTGRIRSSYGFLNVLTGRSSSYDPNLQNIPAHGKQAKLIKEQFYAELGKCIIKQDFNANEVRGYAIVSGDKTLAGRFHHSIQLHKEYRVAGANRIEAAREAWSTGADIHVQNVELFFGKKVGKKDPLRQQVKGVVFGTIYGRGAPSLAEELNISEDEARNLVELFFDTFPAGAGWIEKVHDSGATNFYAVNIFGGRRHLYGYAHASRKVHKAMDRRGPNSLIQGPLSQVGYIAINKAERMIFDWEQSLARKHNIVAPLSKHIGTMNAVHDSQEVETPIVLAPLTSYVLEHAATTQIARYFKDYGVQLIVDFEIEQEVGKDLAHMETLDGRRESMLKYMVPLCSGSREEKALISNIHAVCDIRHKELLLDLEARELAVRKKRLPEPSTLMLMKSKHIVGLHMPDWRMFDRNREAA